MTNHANHDHDNTKAARAACRKAAGAARVAHEAAVQRMLVDFNDVMFRYLEPACHRFLPGQHDTRWHDDMGQPRREVHHHTRHACADALVTAGITFRQICRAYS